MLLLAADDFFRKQIGNPEYLEKFEELRKTRSEQESKIFLYKSMSENPPPNFGNNDQSDNVRPRLVMNTPQLSQMLERDLSAVSAVGEQVAGRTDPESELAIETLMSNLRSRMVKAGAKVKTTQEFVANNSVDEVHSGGRVSSIPPAPVDVINQQSVSTVIERGGGDVSITTSSRPSSRASRSRTRSAPTTKNSSRASSKAPSKAPSRASSRASSRAQSRTRSRSRAPSRSSRSSSRASRANNNYSSSDSDEAPMRPETPVAGPSRGRPKGSKNVGLGIGVKGIRMNPTKGKKIVTQNITIKRRRNFTEEDKVYDIYGHKQPKNQKFRHVYSDVYVVPSYNFKTMKDLFIHPLGGIITDADYYHILAALLEISSQFCKFKTTLIDKLYKHLGSTANKHNPRDSLTAEGQQLFNNYTGDSSLRFIERKMSEREESRCKMYEFISRDQPFRSAAEWSILKGPANAKSRKGKKNKK